jgi:hypothetical protein
MTPDLFAFSISAAAIASIGRHISTAPAKATRGKRVRFIVYDGETVRAITPAGRDAWALAELIHAGADGCTPIDNPGPRWSGYIFKLKRIYGLNIESITERHGGDYAGKHARYVLRSKVRFADPAAPARWEGSRYV